MKHFRQVILKLFQWFLTRRLLKFSIQRENKLCAPLSGHVFLTNHNGWNNLDRGLPKKTVLPNYIEISPMVND